ncbi:cytochrome c biogenesis protein [Zhaonella formicivorans]|uniref:cytochrome c biogenesis protein n=1 Tax=Zhaonella formicivorans TaxID=2528593 RepID=UPI0010E16D72|nr:cytochrome c biogenesis protein CcsA [Zhaonella formicivorans]
MEVRQSPWEKVLSILTFTLLLLSAYAIFWYAPMEKIMREVQKIFYVHVGVAWNSFLAFFVVFIASLFYLKTKEQSWDILASVSAEIGVLFITLVMITGPIWGRSSWNAWWTWEPKLTASLVLWFIYIAYLLIRYSVAEANKRATLSAVFGIIGFLDVPIVYVAVQLWGGYHPVLFGPSGGGLHPKMLQTLILTVFAFTALYFYLLQKGIALENLRLKVQAIKERLRKQFD